MAGCPAESAFSRQQVLEPVILNLNTLVSEMEKMLPRLIGEDIQLNLILDPVIGQVKADPGQIEQVVMNLAVNARDAMPDGGKLTIQTANVELDAAFARDHPGSVPGQYVMLAVTDTGTGMDPEIQPQIFEPFFTTKGRDKGTGLGLATVYGVVKQSSGYIAVESEIGKGALFKIYLPRIDQPVATRTESSQAPLTARGSETILLDGSGRFRSPAGSSTEPRSHSFIAHGRSDARNKRARTGGTTRSPTSRNEGALHVRLHGYLYRRSRGSRGGYALTPQTFHRGIASAQSPRVIGCAQRDEENLQTGGHGTSGGRRT